MVPSVAQQLINGTAFDWSSIEINLDGLLYSNIKSIMYKHSLEPGKGRGTRAQVMLRGRGKYDAEGSIEIYTQEHMNLITALAAKSPTGGYMETPFDIIVAFAEAGAPTIIHRLASARITDEDETHQEGNDLATVKCKLDIMYLQKNGLVPVEPAKFIL